MEQNSVNLPAGKLGDLRRRGSPRWKILVAAVALFALGTADTALSQPKERAARPLAGVPSIMVDVDANGTPIIMRDSRIRPKRTQSEDRASKRAERPRTSPRGSSTYVAPIPLPSTGRAFGMAPPIVTPYNPPPINNPSDRVMQLNQSFQFNGGLGNNPTDRDAYIRYNFNR